MSFDPQKVEKLADPEYPFNVLVSGITPDTEPISIPIIEELVRRSRDRADAIAMPLLQLPCLRQARLTTGGSATVLSALVNRYSTIPEDGDPKYIQSAFNDLLETIPMMGSLEQLSMDRFEDHMAKAGWTKSKKESYRQAITEFESGDYTLSDIGTTIKATFAGKSRETLRFRAEGYTKTRIVYTFEPRIHAPMIRATVPLKYATAVALRQMLVPFLGGRLTFVVPLKGTSLEMEAAMHNCLTDESLIFIAGDDTYLYLPATATRAGLTLAVDLKSCDTTITKPKLEGGYQVMAKLGMPGELIDVVRHLNSCVKVCDLSRVCDTPKVRLTLRHRAMNCSGVGTTTVQTIITVAALYLMTARNHDGRLGSIVETLKDTATKLGLSLEIEKHKTTRSSGLTPVGPTSFLSNCPFIDRNGVIRVVPKSNTKLLLIKGVRKVHRGKDITEGMLARATEPRLNVDPIGRAMRAAFVRNSNGAKLRKQAENPYKFEVDQDYMLDETEHFRFVNQFGTITMEQYQTELANWETCILPMNPCFAGAFPVTELLAEAHYGFVT
jgi:hypothetical protein